MHNTDGLYSVDAERTVLGTLLADNDRFDDIDLCVSDFAHKDHRIIFEEMIMLGNQSSPFDVVSLFESLGDKANHIGGLSYLGGLVKDCIPVNVVHHAKIIKDKAKVRHAAKVATSIIEKAHSNEKSVEIIDFAQKEILGLDDKQLSDVVTIKEMLPSIIDGIDERFQNGGEIAGMSTGFDAVDNKTSGLKGGDLIIVAGRPSMGKTTFSTNIAISNALNGGSSLVFSMEMPKDQLVQREIAALGRIQFSNILSGKLDDNEWPLLGPAVGKLNEINFMVDDSPGLTVSQIRSRSRRAKKKSGVDLIVIDYLQLMEGQGENRTLEIESITRGLKGLARELNVPVVVLSQLNRKLEERSNKRPMMSDLRQSGAIEQDADLILFVYRDEVYNEDSPDVGTAEIIVGKQRNGSIGTVRLIFEGEYCRFRNYER